MTPTIQTAIIRERKVVNIVFNNREYESSEVGRQRRKRIVLTGCAALAATPVVVFGVSQAMGHGVEQSAVAAVVATASVLLVESVGPLVYATIRDVIGSGL